MRVRCHPGHLKREKGAADVDDGNEHSESSSHANNDNDTPRGYRDCLRNERRWRGARQGSGIGREMELKM